MALKEKIKQEIKKRKVRREGREVSVIPFYCNEQKLWNTTNWEISNHDVSGRDTQNKINTKEK